MLRSLVKVSVCVCLFVSVSVCDFCLFPLFERCSLIFNYYYHYYVCMYYCINRDYHLQRRLCISLRCCRATGCCRLPRLSGLKAYAEALLTLQYDIRLEPEVRFAEVRVDTVIAHDGREENLQFEHRVLAACSGKWRLKRVLIRNGVIDPHSNTYIPANNYR